MENHFIACKCPQCGANLDLDKNLEKAFCTYCGTKIITKDIINKVKITNLPDKENFIILGNRAYQNKNYQESFDYFQKSLEYNPDDYEIIFKKGYSAAQLNKNETIKDAIDGLNDSLRYVKGEANEIHVTISEFIPMIDLAENVFKSHNEKAHSALYETAKIYVVKQRECIDLNIQLFNVLYGLYNPNLSEKNDMIRLMERLQKVIKYESDSLRFNRNLATIYQKQYKEDSKKIDSIFKNLDRESDAEKEERLKATQEIPNGSKEVKIKKVKTTTPSDNGTKNRILLYLGIILIVFGLASPIVLITGIILLILRNKSNDENSSTTSVISQIDKNEKSFMNKYINGRLFGFRSGKIYKMILSSMYFFIVLSLFILLITALTLSSSKPSEILLILFLFIALLAPYIMCSNYPWKNKFRFLVEHPKKSTAILILICYALMEFASLNSASNLKPEYQVGNVSNYQIDYENVEDFERDLNNGTDMTNKTVIFTITNTSEGENLYNLWGGEHLNFLSNTNPYLTSGKVCVRILTQEKSDTNSSLYKGATDKSWLLTYEILFIQPE